MESSFDAIRPYYDCEIPPACARMMAHPYLDDIAKFLKMRGGEELREILSLCSNVDDFQNRIMVFVVGRILDNTSDGVTYGGMEYFDSPTKHVIITNHRDIVLDSAIIQYIFHKHKIKTTEIAVGDNLISSQFIEDVARSNKMIKVTRSSSPRELYNSSLLLSEYIRSRVATQKSSIWIAQRNGRTKDGHDITEQGLLKMLEMSGKGDFEADMKELNILPVAISYEFEPCDALKAKELYITRRQKYIKEQGEDLKSILSGMTSWKGRIHFEFTEPVLPEEVEYCAKFTKNERFVELGKIIDKQIHSTYKLWPNNYIAYDIQNGGAEFGDKYTEEQKEKFINYMSAQLDCVCQAGWDRAELSEIFLGIYSNPVKNQKLKI